MSEVLRCDHLVWVDNENREEKTNSASCSISHEWRYYICVSMVGICVKCWCWMVVGCVIRISNRIRANRFCGRRLVLREPCKRIWHSCIFMKFKSVGTDAMKLKCCTIFASETRRLFETGDCCCCYCTRWLRRLDSSNVRFDGFSFVFDCTIFLHFSTIRCKHFVWGRVTRRCMCVKRTMQLLDHQISKWALVSTFDALV